MRKSILINTFFILSLAACTTISDPEKESFMELSRWNEFSVKTDVPLPKEILRDDGSMAFINYDVFSTTPNTGDILLEIYPSINQSCSPNMSRTYGRFVDAEVVTDHMDGVYSVQGKLLPFEDCPVDICKPPLPEFPGKYGFCSEKNGKAVFIEVYQVTDDEDKALSIFKTFKWTE